MPDPKVTGSIGVCGSCGAPLVTVRMADYKRWTPEHGPAWSTPWTRPIRDGEQSEVQPAAGVEAVCLSTRGGQPTDADLAAVREFGTYLRARHDVSPDKAERLARSRQAIAATGQAATPEWDDLTDHEREMSALAARNWLIAAQLAGLVIA